MYELLSDLTLPIQDYGKITFFASKVAVSYTVVYDNPVKKIRTVQLALFHKETKEVIKIIGERTFTETGQTVILNQSEIDAAIKQLDEINKQILDLNPTSEDYEVKLEELEAKKQSIKIPTPNISVINLYDDIAKSLNYDGTLTEYGKTWVPANITIEGVPINKVIKI